MLCSGLSQSSPLYDQRLPAARLIFKPSRSVSRTVCRMSSHHCGLRNFTVPLTPSPTPPPHIHKAPPKPLSPTSITPTTTSSSPRCPSTWTPRQLHLLPSTGTLRLSI